MPQERLEAVGERDLEGINIFFNHVKIYFHPTELIGFITKDDEPENLLSEDYLAQLPDGVGFIYIYERTLSDLKKDSNDEDAKRVFWVLHNQLMRLSQWLASDSNTLPTGGQVEKMRRELEYNK